MHSDGIDSDHFSGSNSSFLANEKLMSVDSMNSDITGILYIQPCCFNTRTAYFNHNVCK